MKLTKKEVIENIPTVLFVLCIGVIIIGLMIYWTKKNDALMEQIAKDEAVASFPAQVVETTNGKKVFIWEKNGKVEGYVIEETY